MRSMFEVLLLLILIPLILAYTVLILVVVAVSATIDKLGFNRANVYVPRQKDR